mmetsp:Transcript_10675/g.15625  ORF Transcript_10675/g.15625 Transcript_10675/m.15625 type:complete len:378 (+) Transcript_10675:109-1242(+)
MVKKSPLRIKKSTKKKKKLSHGKKKKKKAVKIHTFNYDSEHCDSPTSQQGPFNLSISRSFELLITERLNHITEYLLNPAHNDSETMEYIENEIERIKDEMETYNQPFDVEERIKRHFRHYNTRIMSEATNEFLVHLCSRIGFVKVMKYLLDIGCKLSQVNHEGLLPIHLAALRNNQSMLSLVLQYSSVNAPCTSHKKTALHYASEYHIMKNVDILLQQKHIKIDAFNQFKQTPLISAIIGGLVKETNRPISPLKKALVHAYFSEHEQYKRYLIVQKLLFDGEAKLLHWDSFSNSAISYALYFNLTNIFILCLKVQLLRDWTTYGRPSYVHTLTRAAPFPIKEEHYKLEEKMINIFTEFKKQQDKEWLLAFEQIQERK